MGFWSGRYGRLRPLLIGGSLFFLTIFLSIHFESSTFALAGLAIGFVGMLITGVLYLRAAKDVPELSLLRKVVWTSLALFAIGIIVAVAGLAASGGKISVNVLGYDSIKIGLILMAISILPSVIAGMILMIKIESKIVKGEN